jgi:DNA-binding CsgD family transcriptional regulator
MHAIEDEDGDAAIAEVEASGQTVYWLIRGWVGHARAVSFGQKGQRSEAEDAFAQADADLAPCAWYRQHARRLVAEAAIAHGWGDPTGWLTEALVFFDREGYGPIASACRSLLRRAGAPVPRRRRPVADVPASLASMGLTAREVEVLALLATASPTREIAARLYVSPKTVERHIANLAHKVGAEGRSELIAFAASQLSGSDGALDTEP